MTELWPAVDGAVELKFAAGAQVSPAGRVSAPERVANQRRESTSRGIVPDDARAAGISRRESPLRRNGVAARF